MSRTERRTTGKVANWVGYDWRTIINTRQWLRIKLPPKEFAKEIAIHHSDAGFDTFQWPNKWFRQNEQRAQRAKAANEISRYVKDEAYEVQILARPPLPYWD